MRKFFLIRLSFATLMLCAMAGCDRAPDSDDDNGIESAAVADKPRFVGSEVCGSCHSDEFADWQGSHHDLALQPAMATTVLGDFDSAVFEHNGVTSRFYRRDEAYFVETEGADGEIAEFRIAHTFGVAPLQQYLVEFQRGRLQALGIAWDTRPAADGGQRWFHLYGDELVPAGDPLHWTGVLQNWNAMCADCHSTGVAKAYDASADSYATTFALEDVGCEACHGPGSAHAASPVANALRHEAVARSWVIATGTAIASRAGTAGRVAEIDTCAQCHARRAQLHDAEPLAAFLDTYRPERLERALYHDDGQVLDEVFVYGSFLQSPMYAAGVTCSDCHNPHSLELKADGNAVCSQCHDVAVFAAESHRHHPPDDVLPVGSANPLPGCIDCHMRAETFMRIDRRRDHSFRVPRPDLTAEIGSPNACDDCHADAEPGWASARLAEWFPDGRAGRAHFGGAFAAVRDWRADPAESLLPIVDDTAVAPIVRATALGMLGPAVNQLDTDQLGRLAADSSSLVQLALLDASLQLPPNRRIATVQRFLSDAPRALQVAAAQALQPVRDQLSPGRRADFDRAMDALVDAARFGGDRPEGLVRLAQLELANGRQNAARTLLQTANRRFPWFVPAYINLADIERAAGQDMAALDVLDAGIEVTGNGAALALARGLTLVRLGQVDAALVALRQAVQLGPDEPYNAYVLGIALNSSGDAAAALDLLETAAGRFPAYADFWYALATIARDGGDLVRADDFARRGRMEAPGDSRFVALIQEIGAR